MILHYPLLPDFDEKSQSDIVYYTIYASLHSNLQRETRKRVCSWNIVKAKLYN